MADWVITVPKTVRWSDYEKELQAVASGEDALNFRLPYKPKGIAEGDRCFVVYDGYVRGWMRVVGCEERSQGFTCQTTGVEWRPGVYVQRSGAFHKVEPVPYKGFRGIRRYEVRA